MVSIDAHAVVDGPRDHGCRVVVAFASPSVWIGVGELGRAHGGDERSDTGGVGQREQLGPATAIALDEASDAIGVKGHAGKSVEAQVTGDGVLAGLGVGGGNPEALGRVADLCHVVEIGGARRCP